VGVLYILLPCTSKRSRTETRHLPSCFARDGAKATRRASVRYFALSWKRPARPKRNYRPCRKWMTIGRENRPYPQRKRSVGWRSREERIRSYSVASSHLDCYRISLWPRMWGRYDSSQSLAPNSNGGKARSRALTSQNPRRGGIACRMPSPFPFATTPPAFCSVTFWAQSHRTLSKKGDFPGISCPPAPLSSSTTESFPRPVTPLPDLPHCLSSFCIPHREPEGMGRLSF